MAGTLWLPDPTWQYLRARRRSLPSVVAPAGITGTLAVTQAADILAATGTAAPPPTTLLTAGTNAVDATSFATASVDPADDAVVWLHVALRHGTAEPATPTISGCGLTWTLVPEQNAADYYFDTATTRTKHFVFRGHHATPSAGAITITAGGGQTLAGAVWQVVQQTGVDSPASPVVQTASARGAGGTTLATSGTATFAGGVGAANAVLMFLSTFDNAAVAVTPEAGYSQVGFAGPEAGESNLAVGSYVDQVGADATPSVSWTTSALWGLIAVEVAPAVTSWTGTLAATQANQTLTAAGVLRYTGALARTQADQTLAATGQLGASGSLSQTQANQTLAASGTSGAGGVTGTLAQTQAGQTLAATGAAFITPFRENFEGAADGVPITLSNTKFTRIDKGEGTDTGTLVFDDAQSVTGTRSGLFTALSTDNSQAYGVFFLDGATKQFVRFYVYPIATTLNTSGMVRIKGPGGSIVAGGGPTETPLQPDGVLAAEVVWTSTGTLRIRDQAGTSQSTATSALTLNAWTRVEFMVDPATDTLELRTFTGGNVHGVTPTETRQYTSYTHDPGGFYYGQVGLVNFNNGATAAFDEIATSGADWVGPAVTTGTLGVTQAGQTLTAAGGTAQNIGTLAAAQANQTLAATGILRYTGTLTVTQAGQTLTAAGVLRYTGTLSVTQANQTLSAAGTHTPSGVSGTLAQTQANQTLAAAGVLRYTGTLAQTQQSQTLTAAGWIRVTGTLSVTQAANTLSASGVLRYTGTLARTQANQTLAASGTAAAPSFTGTLTVTQAGQTLAASGTVTITGIAGNLSVTQANQTLIAVGVLPGFIAYGVNIRSRSSGPDRRGDTTPGGEARGRTLVGVNVR